MPYLVKLVLNNMSYQLIKGFKRQKKNAGRRKMNTKNLIL